MQHENGSVRRLEAFLGDLEMPCQNRCFIDPSVGKESIRRLGVRPILASQLATTLTVTVAGVTPLAGPTVSQTPPSDVLLESVQFSVPLPAFRS
jgi:hypothetical protein